MLFRSTVKRVPNIENKAVNCPVCNRKSPFVEFKQPTTTDEETDFGSNSAHGKGRASDRKTETFNRGHNSIGQITVISTGQTFKLKHGRNVIGRKADSSQATIQIDTGENRRLSREHLVIDVRPLPAGPYSIYGHVVYLYKEQVNKTLINGSQLLPGEEIALKYGDRIELPDLVLRFDVDEDDVRTRIDYDSECYKNTTT